MLFELNCYKVKPLLDVDINRLFIDNAYLKEYVEKNLTITKVSPINYVDEKKGYKFKQEGMDLVASGDYNAVMHCVRPNIENTVHIQIDINDEMEDTDGI